MGRRKLEMKRIACPRARMVCFSKRRQGLFKKAAEFSRLFNVKVAAFTFSSAGKLFELGDTPTILNTLFPDIPSSSSPSPSTSWVSEIQTHLDVDITALPLSELERHSSELEKIKSDLLKHLEAHDFKNNSVRIGTDEGSILYDTENHNDEWMAGMIAQDEDDTENHNDSWMAGMVSQDEDDTENHNDSWMAGMIGQDEDETENHNEAWMVGMMAQDEDEGDFSMTNEELESILEGMRRVDGECPEAFGLTQDLSFTDLEMGVNEVSETHDFFAGISADDYINELLSSS